MVRAEINRATLYVYLECFKLCLWIFFIFFFTVIALRHFFNFTFLFVFNRVATSTFPRWVLANFVMMVICGQTELCPYGVADVTKSPTVTGHISFFTYRLSFNLAWCWCGCFFFFFFSLGWATWTTDAMQWVFKVSIIWLSRSGGWWAVRQHRTFLTCGRFTQRKGHATLFKRKSMVPVAKTATLVWFKRK